MKTSVLIMAAVMLPLLGLAQAESKSSVTSTFGRHSDCSSGRGICGLSINHSDNERQTANYTKSMSEHSFILTISRKSLATEDEIRIAGKPFKEILSNEQLMFVQAETLLVSKISLDQMKMGSEANKIYPGTYPMFLNKETIEILFTLKN